LSFQKEIENSQMDCYVTTGTPLSDGSWQACD